MSRPQLVTVFGGSGFLGRYVIRRLLKEGYRVRIAVRRPDLMQHTIPMGNVGQSQSVQANIRFPESIAAAVNGADHVINLAGILYSSGAQTFKSVVEEGARNIAQACKAEGMTRLVHVSAIGADETSDAQYAQAKAQAEYYVKEALPDSIILRPSIIFGAEDDFFNRFAKLASMMPAVPLVGADTKFQPVFVDDVAQAIVKAVTGDLKPGATYELGGPDVKSFKELLTIMLEIIDKKRLILSIPNRIGDIMASFLQFAPGGLKLTPDQVKLLANDNIVSEDAKAHDLTLEGMGLSPTAMETVLPGYLVQYKTSGEFSKLKDSAVD